MAEVGTEPPLPVLRKAKGRKVVVHPVQPVRDKLASGGDGSSELPQCRSASGASGLVPPTASSMEAYCRAIGGGC